jgi:hypothetical protein
MPGAARRGLLTARSLPRLTGAAARSGCKEAIGPSRQVEHVLHGIHCVGLQQFSSATLNCAKRLTFRVERPGPPQMGVVKREQIRSGLDRQKSLDPASLRALVARRGPGNRSIFYYRARETVLLKLSCGTAARLSCAGSVGNRLWKVNVIMKIAQVAPLIESVPPRLYGGTERIVSDLTEELVRLGHDVTLFASADSITSAELAPCCTRAAPRSYRARRHSTLHADD